MRRTLTLVGSIVLVCVAAAGCGTGTNSLTSAEYTELVAQHKALSKALVRFPLGGSLFTACRTIGRTTVLVKDARTDCDAEAAEMMAVLDLFKYVCSPGSVINDSPPITTPGNTKPTRRYEAELVCLNPGYRRVAQTAAAEEAADLTLRRELIARGLPGRCVRAIGQNRNALRMGLTFVAAMRKFADDTTLLSKVATAPAPRRAVEVSGIEADEATLKRTLNTYQSAHSILLDGWNNLSVCPHG